MSKAQEKNAASKVDGGLYWVVIDDSEEKELALRYAAHRARANNGHVAIVHVMEPQQFQHWGNVQKQVEKETRAAAEQALWDAANVAYDMAGQICSLYLEQGDHGEHLTKLLNDNPASKMFVLACSAGGKTPGPLVSYFTNKGLGQLCMPLVILSEKLDLGDVDYLGK